MQDIENRNDVILLVDSFYSKVREDELLSPIFIGRIQDNWPIHLEKMYNFWGSILLGDGQYNGRPFPPHAEMNLQKEHFNKWLNLFFDTLEENFAGPKADEAKARANAIAVVFYTKIDAIRANNQNAES